MKPTTSSNRVCLAHTELVFKGPSGAAAAAEFVRELEEPGSTGVGVPSWLRGQHDSRLPPGVTPADLRLIYR